VFQLLESFVSKGNIEEIGNFSDRRKSDYTTKQPPPIKLGPDEDECIDPDVQLALGVGGVQQPDQHY